MEEIQGNETLREKALRIYTILRQTYGERPWRSHGDPLEELVRTILSQNTSDVNSGRAYQRLRQAFPTWEAILDASPVEVAEAIRPGGLAEIKAPRIQAVLRRIRAERGSLNLDFLQEMPVAEARRWLLSLEGVGPKTAACVLLFALHMPAMPVDTHVHRLSLRLGLVSGKTPAEQTGERLEAMLSEELYYPFHILLIQHGREVCKAQRPRCDLCSLSGECDYFAVTRPNTSS